jgi:hypothetical protein
MLTPRRRMRHRIAVNLWKESGRQRAGQAQKGRGRQIGGLVNYKGTVRRVCVEKRFGFTETQYGGGKRLLVADCDLFTGGNQGALFVTTIVVLL